MSYDAEMMDTNLVTTPKLDQLKALGIKTIIRYINPLNLNAEKTVKVPEARAMAARGIRLGLVCEGWGGAKPGEGVGGSINAATGRRDAIACLGYAPKIGAPPGACIYFAVDVDVNSSILQQYVIPYFQAIHEEFELADTGYIVGIYGPGSACQALLDAGLVKLTWLANAMGWSGSRAFYESNRWNIIQRLPKNLAGLDTDPDVANPDRPPDGCFMPFGEIGSIPVPVEPQPPEPAMPDTPAPSTGTQITLPSLNLDTIEKAIGTIQKFLPGVVAFMPAPFKLAVPVVAVLHTVIQFAEELENSGDSIEAKIKVGTKYLRLLADQIDAAFAVSPS